MTNISEKSISVVARGGEGRVRHGVL